MRVLNEIGIYFIELLYSAFTLNNHVIFIRLSHLLFTFCLEVVEFDCRGKTLINCGNFQAKSDNQNITAKYFERTEIVYLNERKHVPSTQTQANTFLQW